MHHSFTPGSIVKRNLGGPCGLLFSHMGVVVGNQQVIHFNGEQKIATDACIVQTTFSDFAAGQDAYMHATPSSIAHSDRIIGHAHKMLYRKENGWNGMYSMISRNCEDFCADCFEQADVLGSTEAVNAKMPTTQVQKVIRSGRLSLSTFSWLLRHPQPIVVSSIVAAIAFFGFYFLHDQLCMWLDSLNQYANRMFKYLETINIAIRSSETVGSGFALLAGMY